MKAIVCACVLFTLIPQACAGGETTVRVAVLYDDAWALNEIEVSANAGSMRVAATHEVLVPVDDVWADQEIAIEIAGIRGGTRYAFGRVDVTPVLGAEVSATIVLERSPCDECTAGSTACVGDGVVVCEAVDGCMRRSTPVACPSTAPFCSLGACDTSCVDECAEGERRCAGPDGREQCGQADSDSCLEWLPAMACADPPASYCVDGSTLRVSETTGTCTDGACVYGVRDQPCAGCPACDLCAGIACDAPPAAVCVNATTLRTYASAGTCENGACTYASAETSCPGGCESGRCVEPCGIWTTTTVDSVGNTGEYTSVAVDASGGIHISYKDSTNLDLRYAYRPAGGSWTTRTVDSYGDVGGFSSIAVDPLGRVHISYQSRLDGALRYAQRNEEGSWSTRTVDTARVVYTSLAIDGNGDIHVGYAGGETLRHAHRSKLSNSWTIETVATNHGLSVSLAVDGYGFVHMSYQTNVTYDLAYARSYYGGGWGALSTVDSEDGSGGTSSVAVDPARGVHITYAAPIGSASPGLRYAFQPLSGSWAYTTVDSMGGAYSSLELDEIGGLHVSYYDTTNRDLRYAYRSPAGLWTTAAVDTGGQTGADGSLALDSRGGVHISYRDDTNDDLRYAYRRACP